MVLWTPAVAQIADVASTGVPSTDDVRHLALTTQVSTTYDTNVTGTNPNLGANTADAGLRRVTPEDVYVEPSVLLDALLPVNREAVFLNGLIGYDFYDRNPVLNRERIGLTGGVSARLSRCQPLLRGTYGRFQSQLAELLPGPNGTNVSPQNVATTGSVGFDVSCPRPEGLAPTLSVTHAISENSNPAFRYTDNTSTSAQAGLSYARPGFGAIQTFGSFTTLAYGTAFVVPFPPFQLKNDFDLYSGGVRLDRPIGSRLSGSVSVSYSSLRPALSVNPGFSGVTYSAEMSYSMSSRWSVHGMVRRAMQPSPEVGVEYVIDNMRQVDANYKLGPRLTLTVGGSDDPQSYRGDLDGKISNLVTSDRIDRVFGSGSFALNKRLSVVLDVAHQQRASNFALYNYTSDRVSLTLKGVF